MDESEDTTTSVMSTGRKQGLVYENPVRAEGIITRDFGTFWLTKDGFPGANEVIVVARKNRRSVQHGWRRIDRRHSIAQF